MFDDSKITNAILDLLVSLSAKTLVKTTVVVIVYLNA